MPTKTRAKRGRRRAPPRRKPPVHSSPTSASTSLAHCRTMTAHELATLLGVDRKTVYQGALRGEIPSIRIGRRVLFPHSAIESWLSASTSSRGILDTPTRVAQRKVTQQ